MVLVKTTTHSMNRRCPTCVPIVLYSLTSEQPGTVINVNPDGTTPLEEDFNLRDALGISSDYNNCRIFTEK